MQTWCRITTVLVFISAMLMGFWIALHKPLWNDEIFSLVSSIHGKSYVELVLGRAGEGNNSPLFYVLQKSLLQALHYQVPAPWLQGHWGGGDWPSQWIVRILPITCMSLSIALIFYLFARQYSLWVGAYSLIVYATSYMLWVYWAESRPYALIILLTTIQVYLLIGFFQGKINWAKHWWLLAVAHVLLSFTFVLSLGQIAAASLITWGMGQRKWSQYICLMLIPMGLCLFYYSLAPKYAFWFDLTPEQLIRDNFSREMFYVLFMMTACVLWDWLKDRLPFGKKVASAALAGIRPWIFFTYATLVTTVIILLIFQAQASPQHEGFPVTSRYFIYLTPIGVAASVWFSVAAVRFLSSWRLIQVVLVGLIAVLFLKRFNKIVFSALHSITGT